MPGRSSAARTAMEGVRMLHCRRSFDAAVRRLPRGLGSVLVATVLALAAASPARAVSYIWNNAAGGNWNVPGNWTPNGVPNTNADTATITLAGTYTVTLDGTFFVKTVTLGGATGTQTLLLPGPAGRALFLDANVGTATMTVNANGVFSHAGGTLAPFGAPAQVTVNGRYDWTSGTVTSGIAITIAPGATLAASGSLAKTLTRRDHAHQQRHDHDRRQRQPVRREQRDAHERRRRRRSTCRANVGIVQTGGGTSTLNNAGLLRKSGGAGTSTISLAQLQQHGDGRRAVGHAGDHAAAATAPCSRAGRATRSTRRPAPRWRSTRSRRRRSAAPRSAGPGAKSIGTGSVPHTYSGTIAATNTTILGGLHTGTFTLNGELTWNAGTLLGAGSAFHMTIPAGATFVVAGAGAKSLIGAGNTARITNSGTLRFSSTSSLQGNDGAFIQNTAGGLIEFLAQGGLGTLGSAQPSVLENAGTVRFASGTTRAGHQLVRSPTPARSACSRACSRGAARTRASGRRPDGWNSSAAT